MKIIGKLLSKKELESYIKKKKINRKINKIILHHTFDTVSQWKNGDVSIKYYKNLYKGKGWVSGPHFFVAPEGVWLFTDINIEGTHANNGNNGSIGIEMVGRYDKKLPSGKIWENTKWLLNILLNTLQLNPKDIHFHREYNKKKSCPGKLLTKNWVKNKLCQNQ